MVARQNLSRARSQDRALFCAYPLRHIAKILDIARRDIIAYIDGVAIIGIGAVTSMTIRNLPDDVKQDLRERAADRSVAGMIAWSSK